MDIRYMNKARYWWTLAALAVFTLTLGAYAVDTTDRQAYVPNQLLVQFKSQITAAERDAVANSLGGVIARPIPIDNCYLVELSPSRGATVESAMTRSSMIPEIVLAEPNYYRYPTAIPNDPMWNQLWGMRMINAPKAWDIEKGKANVTVAVLDTGVSLTHPDLQGRLLPGYDFGDMDDNPNPNDLEAAGHGTHVSGIIAAQGNNELGVVGVCWNNVKILPVKLSSEDSIGMSIAAMIAGLEYAKNQGAQVVNMSLGSPFGSQFEHNKIKELYSAGVIMVAAAGNDANLWGGVHYPARYDECIAVSAVGPTEALASYSNYGPEIDLAAPGGDGWGDTPEDIWSTVWMPGEDGGDGYAGWSGTSMATPHVAGAAGILISAGIAPSRVTGVLYRSARPPVVGVLDPIKYGKGIVDLYSALRTNAEIDIIDPEDADVLDTTTPVFKISTYLVRKESIKVYLDYRDENRDGTPDDLTQNVVLDGTTMEADPAVQWDPSGMLTFTWPVLGQTPLPPGTHTLCVMGVPAASPEAAPVKDWMVFFVQPYVLPAGRHLFSVPYPLSLDVNPYVLFGNTNFRLARYIPIRGDYAKINYPGEPDDPLAWPTNPGVHPHGDTIDTPPAGLGFWVEVTGATPVVVNGVADKSKAYDITLTRGVNGWNMIGNPFPFPVPWESVKVTYQGQTLTLKDAIAAEWIRPAIYRYTISGFTFQTPPDAVLVPWEGHWVRILPNKLNSENDKMVLIVPPVESGSIVEASRSRLVDSDNGWTLRLEARVDGITDGYNFAGVSSRASRGQDMLDVEKPPVITGYVQLAFVHRDWGTDYGRYASDIRSDIGTGETWEFEVTTDTANKDITINWPDIARVPKEYSLVLEDVDSGNRTYMRTRSAYKYNSGAVPGVRRFKLHVEPSNAGQRLLITNVTISQTKGSGVGIGYTISRDAQVQVRVRDNHNKVVRVLGGNTTRAAGINSVHWDCALDDGKQAPVGLYLAEIIATGPDGEVAKSVRPVVVAR